MEKDKDSKFRLEERITYGVNSLQEESYEKGIYIGELIEDKIKVILQKYVKNYVPLYAYMLRELMRNVPEHSESENVTLEIYSNGTKGIFFKVIDTGIGVKNSLLKNPEYSNVDGEKSFLLLSLKPGVTKTYKKMLEIPSEWRNSGFGLFMVSSLAQDLGYFEISSGSVSIRISNNFISEYKIPKIVGTTVGVYANLENSKVAFSKIKDYSIMGKEIIKNSKFSSYAIYKTASMASTLVMDEDEV